MQGGKSQWRSRQLTLNERVALQCFLSNKIEKEGVDYAHIARLAGRKEATVREFVLNMNGFSRETVRQLANSCNMSLEDFFQAIQDKKKIDFPDIETRKITFEYKFEKIANGYLFYLKIEGDKDFIKVYMTEDILGPKHNAEDPVYIYREFIMPVIQQRLMQVFQDFKKGINK